MPRRKSRECEQIGIVNNLDLTFKYFDNVVNYQLNIVIRCPGFDLRVNYQSTNRIFKLSLPKESKTYTLQNLVDYNIGDFKDTDEYMRYMQCEKIEKD